MQQPKVNVIVSLVAGQGEVVQIGAVTSRCAAFNGIPIVIARAGPEAVDRAAAAVLPAVVADERAVVLADVPVDGAGRAVGVVVVSSGNDEVRVPAGHERRDASLIGRVAAIVADDGEAIHCDRGRRRGGARRQRSRPRIGRQQINKDDRRQRSQQNEDLNLVAHDDAAILPSNIPSPYGE